MHARQNKGFTLVELLVVIAIIGILSAIAIPQLLGSREKAKIATCDSMFHGIDGEVANELDGALNGGGSCAATTNYGALGCVLTRHNDLRNPRNRNEKAYIPFPGTDPNPCQVYISLLSTNGVTFTQNASNIGGAERTFSIQIN